jgi:hypothetical protein
MNINTIKKIRQEIKVLTEAMYGNRTPTEAERELEQNLRDYLEGLKNGTIKDDVSDTHFTVPVIRHKWPDLWNQVHVITVPEGFTCISDSFSSSRQLEVVNLPDTITEIYDGFDSCPNLTKVNIGTAHSGIDYIDSGAFDQSYKLFYKDGEDSYGSVNFVGITSEKLKKIGDPRDWAYFEDDRKDPPISYYLSITIDNEPVSGYDLVKR